MEGPPCIEGATCCTDGTWACNEGGGEPTCDEGVLCEMPGDCCEPFEEPKCVEGPGMCCFDGTWMCPDEGGACDGGLGEVCNQQNCCEQDLMPDCPPETNITCCFAGWQCLAQDMLCIPGIVCE
jgi:hypothetical protein